MESKELDQILSLIYSCAGSNENLKNHNARTMKEWFAHKDADLITAKKAILAWHTAEVERATKGSIKPESTEYHRQEMIKCKASLAAQNSPFLAYNDATPGGIANRYRYHKSMYEQLRQPQPRKEIGRETKTLQNLHAASQ